MVTEVFEPSISEFVQFLLSLLAVVDDNQRICVCGTDEAIVLFSHKKSACGKKFGDRVLWTDRGSGYADH